MSGLDVAAFAARSVAGSADSTLTASARCTGVQLVPDADEMVLNDPS